MGESCLPAALVAGAALLALAACAPLRDADARETPAPAGDSWTFAVSGDSRNCGNVVMPSIAAGARAGKAEFYWHLGDLRAIYDFDQDWRALHPDAPIIEYLESAWPDFIASQIAPFGEMPFYVGIGNHETIAPKSRSQFVLQFADWLATPKLVQQRLADDPSDHELRSYYHWLQHGVDFINLDNAGSEQFDDDQLNWLQARLDQAARDPSIRAVVVGMHKALPDSLASDHSMNDLPHTEVTGRIAYRKLLALRAKKPVYVLASHSHFYLANLFDTPYWRGRGGVLPGWIIGTAGAQRYPLPDNLPAGAEARERTYGYLLATVSAKPADAADPIRFRFVEVKPDDLPAATRQRYGEALIHSCYSGNVRTAH